MIWLIGGTSESREIAQLFSQLQMDYLVTVTTPEARALYTNLDAIVRVGPLDTDALVQLIEQYHITCIVDASHPHAQLISQQAIDSQTPYLRYERPQVFCPTGSRLEVKTIDSLIQGDYLEGQRVLFTIGYKGLARFRSFQSKATLFTRILPSLTALTAALEAGFTSDRIIALRPPVNRETTTCSRITGKINSISSSLYSISSTDQRT
jgi:precorrin-6A/cobalt-precorrin-6A reductase